jgi:adenylate cyclase
LLTSKEIIERTGISRATLNNYIATGLVARPQVLAPGPEDSAAPRIGYFPDDTIDRVLEIQRLKREGWSIGRIADHFAKGDAPPPPRVEAKGAPAPTSAPLPAPARVASYASASSGSAEALVVSLGRAGLPAYFVDDRFAILWQNDASRVDRLSPLARAGGGTTEGSVLARLATLAEGPAREALLRHHLQAAIQRLGHVDGLLAQLPAEAAQALARLPRERSAAAGMPVSHGRVPAADGVPARWLYAVHFKEGVLFALSPAGAADHADAVPAGQVPPPPPELTPVAILACTLQDAPQLWLRLSAQEFFELANEVWAEMEDVFRRHGGRPGRHPDDGLVCYFLPQPEGSHLWSALAAAHQVRHRMRQISRRWRQRKGWDAELVLNSGVDEGQDWMGLIGSPEPRVLGEAAERAAQLSRCARDAILVTRNLIGKLSADERARLQFGVPRAPGADGRVLHSFARLADLAPPGTVPARLADLPVAELFDRTEGPAA